MLLRYRVSKKISSPLTLLSRSGRRGMGGEKRLWTFAALGGSRGWGGKRRHLWFAQFPRTFRPSTTKRDFALWLCSPFLLDTFPKIPRPYQSFRRSKDFRKNPCFSEFYKFIYIDRTKDLGIWFRLSFDETIGNRAIRNYIHNKNEINTIKKIF